MVQIKKDKFFNIIGLMSGTSLDGIDVSLVRSNGNAIITSNKNYYYKYRRNVTDVLTKGLKSYTKIINNEKLKKKYDNFITKLHLNAIKKSGFLDQCDLIGFHGQTIYHNPSVRSVQLGNPKMLSNLLMKDVVFNFRENDIIYNGQGAPLAPIYHKTILANNDVELPGCFLNIGGISNITYWDGKYLIGFDTGPGNNLMDEYIQMKTNYRFDNNGKIASRGTVNKKILKNLMSNEYFKKTYPKSLDKYSFKREMDYFKLFDFQINDALSTLAEFTVTSIINAIKKLPKYPKSIVIAGGGYKNKNLILKIKEKLDMKFYDLHHFNHDPDFIEAELIAFLSARHVNNLPITFPLTTGVVKPTNGGVMYAYS